MTNHLIVDPLATCGFSTDEHDGASPALHLLRNPTLDLLVLVGATRDRFPLLVRSRLVAFDDTNASDSSCAPVVRFGNESYRSTA